MEEQKASWFTKISYGIGATGKGLSYGAFGKLEFFIRNVLHMDDKFFLTLTFLERIWDGVNDLIMGTIIDNTHSKWGKFRPWCAIGAVTNSLVVIAMFGLPDALRSSPLWMGVYIAVFYLLWDMTYTMVDVAYYAQIPALSSTPGERNQFATIPRLFSGLFGIAGNFAMVFIEMLGGGKTEAALKVGLFRYAAITSIIYVVTSVYSAAMTKERVSFVALPTAHDALQAEKKQEKFSLVDAVKILWGNKQVLVIVGVMILLNMASNVTTNGAGNYFYFVRGSASEQSLFGMLMGGAQGVGLLLFPLLGKALGRLKVYSGTILLPCLGYAAMAAASLLIQNKAGYSLFVALAAGGFIANIGYGSMSVMQSVMLADGVDYGEYETGRRNEGIIFSMLTLLSKFAGAFTTLATTVTYMTVRFGGKFPNDPTPLAQTGISFLMYILPPVLLLAAFALYKGAYKLTPERMTQVKAEMEARKRAQGKAAEEILI